MSFKPGEPTGQAVLVPCVSDIEAIESLVDEANALWMAEDANATRGVLCKTWGCVGALFGSDEARDPLRALWCAHFRKVGAKGVSVVTADGLLDVAWPKMLDGWRADFDVILATATVPDASRPTSDTLAGAWVSQQGGNENYFFNNVEHGIRTPDDIAIWRGIEALSPPWLKAAEYAEAMRILRSGARAVANQ
jgi:hypothetical protein